MESDTLATYPYVVLRLACRSCRRKGRYRLARLAETYGSEMTLDELLAKLAGDCRLWHPPRGCEFRCGAYFVDVETPSGPVDLPQGLRGPKLVR